MGKMIISMITRWFPTILASSVIGYMVYMKCDWQLLMLSIIVYMLVVLANIIGNSLE